MQKLLLYLRVGKNSFYTGLHIVKITVDGAYEYIAALLGGHLQLLHTADALIREKHRDAHAVHIAKAFKRGLARIAGGSHKNQNIARFSLAFAYFKKRGKICSATSLKARVGP